MQSTNLLSEQLTCYIKIKQYRVFFIFTNRWTIYLFRSTLKFILKLL